MTDRELDAQVSEVLDRAEPAVLADLEDRTRYLGALLSTCADALAERDPDRGRLPTTIHKIVNRVSEDVRVLTEFLRRSAERDTQRRYE